MGLLSRLEPPTGIKSGAFIPVVVLHRDRNLLLVFFLSSACGSVYISLISISPPILPSLSYLLPSPTLPPLVAQPERLTERRAAGGEAPGGGFGHGDGSARVAKCGKLPSADGGEDLLHGTRRRRGPAARGAASRVALARRAASAVSGERPRTWPSR